ncbi:MAG: IPTL-CTERM sorting domain-containing protein, partial [Xanthomonadales bacterium]|nr:IPTL-CTERM sorting domain-containing protein [Xanthomonadales bacterium]
MKPASCTPRLLGGIALMATLFYASTSFAGITTVTRGGTQPDPANCAPSVSASPMAEGVTSYCDRDYTWTDVTGKVVDGAEYLIVANDDKEIGDYSLEVVTDVSGTMYLIWNNLITPPQWVTDLGFASTGETVTLLTGDNDPVFDVYSLDLLNGGTTTLYGPNDSTRAIYTVAFVEDPQVDLVVSISDDPDPVLAGSGTANFVGTFSVSNTGADEATNVEVTLGSTGLTDAILEQVDAPVGTTFLSPTWSIPSLGAGESLDLAVTVTIGVNQTAGTDVISWTSAATADQPDLNPDDNTVTELTSVTSAADQTSTFATSIVFTNGATGSVTAELSCNAGSPLEQSFDISEASPVTFTMTNLPFTTPGTICEIAVTDIDGYTIEASANGGAADDSCMYVAPFDGTAVNTCEITATPNRSEFEVDIDFDGIDDPAIDLDWNLEVVCEPAAADADSTTFPGVTWNVSGTGSAEPLFWFYAEPEDGTDCTATLSGLSTAIEQDGPCTIEEIAVGEADDPDTEDSETPTCTITATAFYEGIPTLSQYGLALMALLMLGVGFI